MIEIEFKIMRDFMVNLYILGVKNLKKIIGILYGHSVF